jgi:hypothetical protein
MDNPETLSKLDTKNTGRRQTKQNQKKTPTQYRNLKGLPTRTHPGKGG